VRRKHHKSDVRKAGAERRLSWLEIRERRQRVQPLERGSIERKQSRR